MGSIPEVLAWVVSTTLVGKKGSIQAISAASRPTRLGLRTRRQVSLESYLLPCVCPFAACASRRMSDVVDLDWEEQQPQEPTTRLLAVGGPFRSSHPPLHHDTLAPALSSQGAVQPVNPLALAEGRTPL